MAASSSVRQRRRTFGVGNRVRQRRLLCFFRSSTASFHRMESYWACWAKSISVVRSIHTGHILGVVKGIVEVAMELDPTVFYFILLFGQDVYYSSELYVVNIQ